MKDSTFEKYKLVINEYLSNGMNGTGAYRKFYPDSSDDACTTSFIDILAIPRVAKYLEDRQKQITEDLQLTHLDLLKELYNWAYSDVTETMLLSPEEIKRMPIEMRRLVTRHKTTTKTYQKDDVITKEVFVELWFVSKEKALEMIARHLGFYELDNNQKTPISMTQEQRDERVAYLKNKLGQK